MTVAGILDPRSVGVHAYATRLAAALNAIGVDYRLGPRRGAALLHIHLANSTRSVIGVAARQRRGFLLTVHDVLPRRGALAPLQRVAIAPVCSRRAERIVVHSEHAAEMLGWAWRVPAARVRVVHHAATAPSVSEPVAARLALGLVPDGPPLFVLPGTLKPAKLVAETLEAAEPLLAAGALRLLLAGHFPDPELRRRAQTAGAEVLAHPRPAEYEHAIVAADVVLCPRAASVGESNGPLLEAIGAGRPSLITGVGSAPEVAGDSGLVVSPSARGIASGLRALIDPAARAPLATAARRRARELSWEHSARRHAELIAEVMDA